jgi:hypothetical protein
MKILESEGHRDPGSDIRVYDLPSITRYALKITHFLAGFEAIVMKLGVAV